MNKKKIFFCVLLLSMMCSFKASAQLKLDGLSGVERVLTSVQTGIESVMKKVNEAAKIFQGKLWGDSASSAWETFKALRTQVKDTVAAGMEVYEEVKDLGQDAESLLKDSYEELKDEISDFAPVSTATLEVEISGLEGQMEDRKAVVAEEINAKIKAAQQNEQIYAQLYEAAEDEDAKESLGLQLASEQAILSQLQTDLNTLSEDGNAYLAADKQYQDLKEARDAKSQELADAIAALEAKGKGLAASFIQGIIKKSPEEKAADYNAVQMKNFAGEDEELTQEVVNRINKERVTNLGKDLSTSFAFAVNYRKKSAATESSDCSKEGIAMPAECSENQKVILNNMEGVDMAMTALRLQNKMEIVDLNVLHDRILMETAYLRLKSSRDMLKQPYRLINPDKDPTQMNLDDYVITKESIEAQVKEQLEGD